MVVEPGELAPGGSGQRSQPAATGALVLAAFFFGSTFLVVQGALDHVGVWPFLAVRFLVAALVLWPVARRRAPSPLEVRHGMVAGACLLFGYATQTLGLRYTSSSTSAFITYLLVVIVPVITAVTHRRLPRPNVVAGVLVAVVGLVLLSGGVDAFGKGELLSLGAALGFALHIVVLGRTSAHHDAIRLTLWQVLTVGLVCAVPGAVDGGFRFAASAWAAAVFCGVCATALAFFCMVWAQQVVSETRAAIVLLLEPVFAAVLGYASGERLGAAGAVGAVLILVAVLLAELWPTPVGPVALSPAGAVAPALDDDDPA